MSTGTKGIPEAHLPRVDGQENLDLFPYEWLIDRWCSSSWGSELIITTPKGQKIKAMWRGNAAYLTPKQIEQIFKDLPEPNVVGRKGNPADNPPTAAAVLLNLASYAPRAQMSYIAEDGGGELRWRKIRLERITCFG